MDIDSLKKIQTQFPSLKDGTHYLDSAASSLTPVSVLESMDEYYREYRANVHRGLYASAERASEAYEGARKKVADFIGAHPEEIIFTSGATGSANMLVYALEHTYGFMPGDEIVMTVAEHHALLVPLQELAKRNGMVLKYAQLTKDFALDVNDLHELITEKTRIVAVMGASNVTGSIFDLPAVPANAGEAGVERPIIIRDITALVGHALVDVTKLGADFAFFSGHKMCGPTGVGVLWGKKEQLAKLQPGFFGGGMISEVTFEGARYQESVERFEPGTPNIAGVIGLGEAVSYLETIGLENIHAHVRELVTYAQEQLAGIQGITLYSALSERNVGTISFTIEGIHPHDVAQICADSGVAVRPGHHCAQPLHIAFGISATTRASFYLYNTKEDIDALVDAVGKVREVFNIR
jgi:cysteine desulfurase/selenocysteine lyase